MPIARQTNHLIKRITVLQLIHQKTLLGRETVVGIPARAADATQHGMLAVIPGFQPQAPKETAGIERLRKRGNRRLVLLERDAIHTIDVP